jgi:DNA-binding NarL/FixJ family response regulator
MLAVALQEAGFRVYSCGDPVSAVQLWEAHDPDGAVIDIHLGTSVSGLALAERIRRLTPAAALVFLTSVVEPRVHAPGRVPVGSAYIDKARVSDVAELVNVVHASLLGVQSVLRHDRDRGDPLGAMTQSQLEVLALVAQGLSNDDIARHRGTSVRAVERLLGRALARMGTRHDRRGHARVTASVAYARLTST